VVSNYDRWAADYDFWAREMTEDVAWYEARRRAGEAGVELDLRLADIRDLELEEPADRIYCPFRSLTHLPTWHDKRRLFERVAASLRPGGREGLIDVAGLEVEALYGGFRHEPFTDESRELAWVARKPA
jgi:SAM-dependent methyltransferase